jgi:hypothetical protein
MYIPRHYDDVSYFECLVKNWHDIIMIRSELIQGIFFQSAKADPSGDCM